MYAVITDGSRQYRVTEGDVVKVDYREAEPGAQPVDLLQDVALYHHIQRLSLSFHDRSRTGDLISRATSDIDAIQSFITSGLLDTLKEDEILGILN